MKKILYTILSVLPMVVIAQNVGVNTDTPKHTLDVEGTMRISEPGPAKITNIPLAWSENKQQVIKGTNLAEGKYPFYYATFKINMSKTDSDYANGIDLKINTDKYVAVLVQSFLVDRNFTYENPSRSSVFMRMKAKSETNGTEKLLSISNDKDKGFVDDSGNYIESESRTDRSNRYKIAIPLQQARLIKDDTQKTYKFFGDYSGSNPLGNKKFSWFLSVLIIDKDWVKVTGL